MRIKVVTVTTLLIWLIFLRSFDSERAAIVPNE
jgi:hypothetical protein